MLLEEENKKHLRERVPPHEMKNPKPMSPWIRDLILTVLDGDRALMPVLYYLKSYRRYEQILLWLIRNRLTGHQFREWISHEWGTRLMDMTKHILMKIDRGNEPQPIFMGGEFLG